MAGCGPFCGSASTSGPAQHLVFTGPVAGTLTAAHVDCRVYGGAGQFNAAITGTLTIDKGGASGAMDAGLSSGEHVKGTFRCDEVHTA